MRTILLVSTLLALAAFGGCVERNVDETRQPDSAAACTTRFVTIHYETSGNASDLRGAFEAAGYEWIEGGASDTGAEAPTSPDRSDIEGVATLDTPTEGVRGVVSHQPGTSSLPDVPASQGLIVSFEAVGQNVPAERVDETARQAAGIVNATFEDARVEQWLADTRTGGCDPLGGPQTGIR